MTIIHGDCLDQMRKMESNSIDFIVTDPPYFLTNNSGSGFMGKSWDSTHELPRYLWQNNTFVNSVLKFFRELLLEDYTEEEKHVQPNVNMLLSNKTKILIKEQLKNVQYANLNSKVTNVQKKDSADLLVLTKQEVLDLLKGSCPSHIKIVETFLNGVKKNALFVIPISLLNASVLKNTVHKNVLPKLRVKNIEVKEIPLSLMDQVVLKNAIEVMTGTRLEKLSTEEINGNASIVSNIVDEKKFNVITSYHIDQEELINWITSLLCVINATQSSRKIQNYLIQNFFQVIFEEALRICKPGSMLAAFGGSRTHHNLMTAIEESGWEIRDCMFYFYGSGFPKSHNFGKKLDEKWKGYGTCLKPAYEPIILAMKPLQGTFMQNAEKYGVAGINIDECRIPGTWERSTTHRDDIRGGSFVKEYQKTIQCIPQKSNVKGRWPSQIILDEEAAEMLDEMTSHLKSGHRNRENYKSATENLSTKVTEFGSMKHITNFKDYDDCGGASRFFYCAKASSSERNKGLEKFPFTLNKYINNYNTLPNPDYPDQNRFPKQNHHPTVKPISLMKYIIKLLAPPGDPLLLDPFAGSGSTILAAQELGIRAIGIEKEEDYCKIARERLKNANHQMEMRF